MVYVNRRGGSCKVGRLRRDLEVARCSSDVVSSWMAFMVVVMSLMNLLEVSNGQSVTTPICSATDRDALLRFKEGVTVESSNSTTTPNCDLSSWTLMSSSSLESTNCCDWAGVKCDILKGHVVELNLSSCALTGVIQPKSLGNVSALEVLDLSNNTLHGDTPADLLQLRNLRFFSVAANGFNPGTFINSNFGTLTNLTHLDLGQSFKLKDVTTLTKFPAGEVCNLKNVTHLNLKGCYLVGALPDCFGTLSELQFLDLSGNDLQGSLLSISALSGLRKLESLTLAGVYSQKTKLRLVLDSIQQLNSSLAHLDLRENNLTGVIPHSIEAFANLRHLDLGSNLLTGTITSSVFHLPLLEVLRLDRNQFEGILSPAIGNLCRHLKELNVTMNALEGVIPEEIGQCGEITSLDLSNNRLTGTVPKSIGKLGSLRYLSLLRNADLGGDLPPEIGNLSKLEFLDFSHDAFKGTIPWSWGDGLSQLRFLHGTTNQLSGNLPLNLGNLTSLISLDLSYNNNITGPLPAKLGYSTSGVYRILFCSNKMTGGVPPEWNNLGATLKSLSLYDNKLTGPIPNMTKLAHLEVLDLSYNTFTGEFPSWIKLSRDTLRVLELSQNNLEGPLPSWLSSFPSLQIMNLGGNSFTGTIPENLRNLTTMTNTNEEDDSSILWTDQVVVTASGRFFTFDTITINTKSLDFHGNKLSGPIPSELATLHGLYYLNLGSCNLSGSIPPHLSNLTSLLTLDLSSNRLTGPIPPELAEDLVNLQFLNLSSNNLSGSVPQAHQFASFNSTAFENNPLLCGPPTNRTCKLVGSSGGIGRSEEEESRWEDYIDNRGFALGSVVGFLMMVATIGMWTPARRWMLKPVVEDLWYNGYYKHPI